MRLHENNVLNNRLLPLKRADIQQKLHKSVLQSLKRVIVETHSIYLTIDESKQFFVYPLIQNGNVFKQNESVFGGNKSLCIISHRQLMGASNFDLDLAHNQLHKVTCSFGTCRRIEINERQWDTCCKFYATLMNSRWRRRTGHLYFEFTGEKDSIHTPFIVSCLRDDGVLDLDYMVSIVNDYGRNDSERMNSVKDWNGSIPRLFAPIYDPNNTYIALRFDEKKSCATQFPDEQYSTYSDYYARRWSCKIDDRSKLIQVQRCWELPSKITSEVKENDFPSAQNHDGGGSQGKTCNGLVTVLLPQDACIETPLSDPHLQLHSVMLPQILFELERVETIHAFLGHCTRWSILTNNIEKIPFIDVLVAFTAKSCSYGRMSYDRLEYLGDAVLKLIHTDTLINSNDDEFRKWFHCLHEGDLTELRTAMGCNERLRDIAVCAGFHHFILTTPLGRGTWLPRGFTSYRSDREECKHSSQYRIQPSAKVVADVVESLLVSNVMIAYLFHFRMSFLIFDVFFCW